MVTTDDSLLAGAHPQKDDVEADYLERWRWAQRVMPPCYPQSSKTWTILTRS